MSFVFVSNFATAKLRIFQRRKPWSRQLSTLIMNRLFAVTSPPYWNEPHIVQSLHISDGILAPNLPLLFPPKHCMADTRNGPKYRVRCIRIHNTRIQKKFWFRGPDEDFRAIHPYRSPTGIPLDFPIKYVFCCSPREGLRAPISESLDIQTTQRPPYGSCWPLLIVWDKRRGLVPIWWAFPKDLFQEHAWRWLVARRLSVGRRELVDELSEHVPQWL